MLAPPLEAGRGGSLEVLLIVPLRLLVGLAMNHLQPLAHGRNLSFHLATLDTLASVQLQRTAFDLGPQLRADDRLLLELLLGERVVSHPQLPLLLLEGLREEERLPRLLLGLLRRRRVGLVLFVVLLQEANLDLEARINVNVDDSGPALELELRLLLSRYLAV